MKEINLAERVYRPPSEADSLILQVTLGCSYNECTFCGMYRDKPFRIRPLQDLLDEIAWAKQTYPGLQKVFLADGDALIAKANHLAQICDALTQAFPELRRISIYASPQALQIRSVEEMTMLREKGLSLYYLGIESGDDQTLLKLQKGVDSQQMIAVGLKAQAAGVKLSTMILLNGGGRKHSLQHARGSAQVVNAIQPRFVSTLVLTPTPKTPIWDDYQAGNFDELSVPELAKELREFITCLDLTGTIFRSNHASNWLTISGTLPKDKTKMLSFIDRVLLDVDE